MRRDGPPQHVIRRKHPVGGVTFHAIDERRFVEDLAACRAVVAAAGNQLVGEALHLGKPMLLLPEKAHAEQLMTSDFLSAMGCGDFVLLEEVGRDRVRSFVDEAGSHDTSRIAWAKLMARVGAEFPLQCPSCGGDIRLIAFITEPGPIRKILTGTASGLMSTMRNMPASSHARWTWIFAPWPDEPMRRYMNMTNLRADLCE